MIDLSPAPARAADRAVAPGRHAPDTSPTSDSGRQEDAPSHADEGVARGMREDIVATSSEGAVSPLQRVGDNSPYRTPETAGSGTPDGALIVLPPGVLALLDEPAADPLDDAAAEFAAASKSAATRRAYLSGLRDFEAWCRLDSSSPLPATPRTVSRYVTHLAGLGRTVSTIDQRVAAIAYIHRLDGRDSPTTSEQVRAVLAGIRNTKGRRPTKKKALTADLVAQVVKKIPSDLVGLRDRALILLCFGAALRRSELVGLDVGQLEAHRRGLLVRLGKTKTDQTGQGRTVAILTGKLKVPDAVAAWIAAAAITSGPVFRGIDRGRLSSRPLSAVQFIRVLKARCAAVGIDPDMIGGHSPRRGWATSAGDAGADLRRTAGHMRHAKLETTMGYMEDGDLFRENAGRGFM